ncbi:MAG: tRNA preQ1(34) S-adenosylmethionine ribosyltransferase-isomerase QueA [Anaerolineales bacterium]|nr:tRNA preQ1(34) S-adenosylmethionine ribosyltransferase-isomerase QueA [Anaerolineales bacterium]
MRLNDFEYSLPPEYIAQSPLEPRDSSRLMVLDRAAGGLRHTVFRNIGEFLSQDDLLVFNDTRVIPARLAAVKEKSGGKVEVLLLRRLEAQVWEALVGGKHVRVGTRVSLTGGAGLTGLPRPIRSEDALSAEVVRDLGGSRRILRFSQPITPRLSRIGSTPLPPYIHETLRDPERYQTVFARDPGSAAAPTAGLHFTPELLVRLRDGGVRTAFVTLHVGLDTFLPIAEPDVESHEIHAEWIRVPEETAAAVRETRARGRRVVAVGTTSVRALESSAAAGGGAAAYEGDTRLYITPGYEFRAVDSMITNFHLPHSTLLVMVSAFAGRERILAAYEEAKREGYRFYSFGDAMLIV